MMINGNPNITNFGTIDQYNKYAIGKYGDKAGIISEITDHDYSYLNGYMILSIRIDPKQLIEIPVDVTRNIYSLVIVDKIFHHDYKVCLLGCANYNKTDTNSLSYAYMNDDNMLMIFNKNRFKPFEMVFIIDMKIDTRNDYMSKLIQLSFKKVNINPYKDL